MDESITWETFLDRSGKVSFQSLKRHSAWLAEHVLKDWPDAKTWVYYQKTGLEPVRCKTCGGIVPVKNSGIGVVKVYCCRDCVNHDELNRKRAETSTKRYGVTNPSSLPETRQKVRETNLQRFGVETPQQSESVRKKTEETNIKRYGVKTPLQTEEVKAQIRRTMLEKYGSEHPMGVPEFAGKARETSRKNWGCAFPMQSDVVKARQMEALQKRFGVENASQRHLSKDVLDALDDPNALKKLYNSLGSAEAVAREMDVAKRTIVRRMHDHGLSLDNNTSSLELRMRAFLDSIGVSYVSNERTVLDGKEIDILIPDYKIGIELNGLYWHSFNPLTDYKGPREKDVHSSKYTLAKTKGIKLLQFFEDQINDSVKFEIIKSIIKNHLGMSKRVFARKTDVAEIDSKTAHVFLEDNHLDGFASAKHHFGLFLRTGGCERALVAVMTFGQSRFEKDKTVWEVIRFATLRGHSVVGGGSKLVNHFRRFMEELGLKISKLVSYADKAIGDGESYRKIGFEEGFVHGSADVAAGYFWVVGGQRHHRQRYQRHKLERLHKEGVLPKYDGAWTESEVMYNNGHRKLYNVGYRRWVIYFGKKEYGIESQGA